MKTKNLFLSLAVFALAVSCSSQASSDMPEEIRLSKEELLDRIKGGWAGQTIGVTYGGPTEFRYPGTMIQDYIPIPYNDHYLKWWYDNAPGLYDDVYMDLTFVDVFDKYGLDAPVEKFANAFANADYNLWHANQAARYNILNGVLPPESGFWKNNPHADDIDFQIEADYAGLMAPGMVNSAVHYADEIGHIMNYGDGWYGGVFVAAMYSLAFVYDDINTVVREAIKIIPSESRFRKCIDDVIRWYEQYPNDWKQTWAECEKKWSSDVGCPDGVFVPFNIDAVINSAYVAIGLLYGEGDFEKTMDISTRCGQDSDCNPATAGGILATMFGYSHIPEKWMPALREVEDINFAYTDISLNKAYRLSFEQALQVIERNGGTVTDNEVIIKCQKPEMVRLEQGFTGVYPKERKNIDKGLNDGPVSFDFVGNALTISYYMPFNDADNLSYVGEVEVKIDGQVMEIVKLPDAYATRKHELYFNYDLDNAEHHVEIKCLNPKSDKNIWLSSALVYKPM